MCAYSGSAPNLPVFLLMLLLTIAVVVPLIEESNAGGILDILLPLEMAG